MKIVGLVIARACTQGNSIPWDFPLEGSTLLEHAVRSLQQVPYTDQVFVLTDQNEQLERGDVNDAASVCMPDWFFEYGVPFFSKEQWLLTRAMQALTDAGAMGDVLLIADWRKPLVYPRTLETMYHKLMDDRVAARTVGICPLDPNLFLRLNEERFFPVWADIGADRQAIPQLYRSLNVGAVRPDRLLTHSPETCGVPLAREEAVRITDAESLELARFYLQRRCAKDADEGQRYP